MSRPHTESRTRKRHDSNKRRRPKSPARVDLPGRGAMTDEAARAPNQGEPSMARRRVPAETSFANEGAGWKTAR